MGGPLKGEMKAGLANLRLLPGLVGCGAAVDG
jgi:hypothetical protein